MRVEAINASRRPSKFIQPEWPAWAKAVREMRVEADAGVGDTIARVIGPLGGESFKQWTKKIGFNCGCDARQHSLNRKYPYAKLPANDSVTLK